MEFSEIVERLAASEIFAEVPAPAIEELARAAEQVEVEPGRFLIREHEESLDLFLVVKGTAVAVGSDADGGEVIFGRVSGGDLLGEMQALTGGKRTASVRAETEMTVLRLLGPSFAKVAAEHTVILEKLARRIRERHRRNALRSALRARYYVAEERVVREIEERVEWQHLDRGAILTRQGEPSKAIWFLLSGRLEAVRTSGDGTWRAVEILPGESVGEAVMPDELSDATVSATRPSEVGRIHRNALAPLLERHPGLARGLLEVTLQRIRHPERGLRSGQTVAVLPIGRGVPITDVVQEIIRNTDPDLRTVLIDRSAVRSRFGAPDLSELAAGEPMALRLTAWLEQVEAKHEVVLYEVDRCDSPWARLCVSIAEEIVLLARASDDPTPSPEERRLLAPGQWPVPPHVTLVLIHDSGGPVKGTERWLAERTVDTVIQVRRGEIKDLARVARFVTRRAVGVVMSGGAARGWAAVGVLQALEELGVPIDAVGGVSCGAVIAATYAAGWTQDQTLAWVSSPSSMKQFGLGLPSVSLASAKRWLSYHRELFGTIRLEDLWRPCFFVSTNLTRATQRLAARGDLVENLLASNAMPPILPPVSLDGDLCVDGAFVNNIPIAEMATFVRGGPVIAIDVTPSVKLVPPPVASGKKLSLRDRFRDTFQLDAPLAFETILCCQLVHHVEQMRTVQKQASLYLAPDVRQFGLMAHWRARDIARAGHEQSAERIQSWWSNRTLNMKIVQESRRVLESLDFQV